MTATEVPDCLYYLVTRTAMVATNLLKQSLAEAGISGVKPAFLGVLQILWREDGIQAATVAHRAALEPSTTTGLLDKLQKLGLVERRADPDDRRAVRIHLTRQGCALERKVTQVVDQVMLRAARGIPLDDVLALQRTLKTFLANHLVGFAPLDATNRDAADTGSESSP